MTFFELDWKFVKDINIPIIQKHLKNKNFGLKPLKF